MYISYHLEPLLEKFNHLKHVTFSILIEEKEPWEPQTLVNTVTELREKGIRVSVFLDWGTRQVVKPAGGGKIDVSSYFDEPRKRRSICTRSLSSARRLAIHDSAFLYRVHHSCSRAACGTTAS